MLLELQKVSRMYGTRCVFKDVSLTVPAASLTLLVGANGAGKSTLMHLMAGLARPSVGTVRHHLEAAEIAYLGHATFLYPALTAVENLRFWGSLYDVDVSESALDAVLARVDLSRHRYERAAVFSRGMAQRLNVARVLLLQPRLLLLDEPATGLDSASVHLLRREIGLARERGAAIVWISHDVHSDLSMADRLLVLHDRRLVYDGEPGGYAPLSSDQSSGQSPDPSVGQPAGRAAPLSAPAFGQTQAQGGAPC